MVQKIERDNMWRAFSQQSSSDEVCERKNRCSAPLRQVRCLPVCSDLEGEGDTEPCLCICTAVRGAQLQGDFTPAGQQWGASRTASFTNE